MANGAMVRPPRATSAASSSYLTRTNSTFSATPTPSVWLCYPDLAHVEHALRNPDPYWVMFDAAFDLPDPEGASASFELLVQGTGAALRAGRFSAEVEPSDVALRYWASGHGLTSLAVVGVLPLPDLRRHALATAVAIFTAAGDRARTGRTHGCRSVAGQCA